MSVSLWAVADSRFRPIADTPVIRNRALRGRKADIRRVARSAGVRDWAWTCASRVAAHFTSRGSHVIPKSVHFTTSLRCARACSFRLTPRCAHEEVFFGTRRVVHSCALV